MILKETYTHIYAIKILDSHVIVVASINKNVNDWSAYIGHIEFDLEYEWVNTACFGSKLDKRLAEILFPMYAMAYKWRD